MARLLISIIFALAATAIALAASSAEARKTTAPSSPIHLLHPFGRHHAPPPEMHVGTSSISFHSAAGPSKHHRGYQGVGKNHPHHHHLGAAESPDGDTGMPPEPYPGFYECLERLTPDCGAEIYRGVFGQRAVTARCCGQLVELGQKCHRGILKATLVLPEMAKVDRSEVKARDAEIWSQCVFITSLKAGNSGTSRLPILP